MLTPLPRTPAPSGLAPRLLARLGTLALIGFLLVWMRAVLIPIVLAALAALLAYPVARALRARRVPAGLARFVAVVAVMLPILLFIGLFVATGGPLQDQLEKRYEPQLALGVNHVLDLALSWIHDPQAKARLLNEVSNNVIPQMVQGTLGFMQIGVNVAVGLFLTLLFMAFMLIEGPRFRDKLTEAYGPRHPLLQSLDAISRDVRAYVAAKTLISAATGLCAWAFLAACGVDFAAFWGLIAFPLNFVPTVGALVASVPPVVLAMLDPHFSGLAAAGVAVGLLVINAFIGSYVDPRFIGRQVKVSPLIVFLSMVIWGLLWGPSGMILAVPIMVSVKVVCSHVPGLEPVAILMKA